MRRKSHPIEILRWGLDHGILKELIQDGIAEAFYKHGRRPNKSEVLDAIFTSDRHDPEAVYLAKRLDAMLDRILKE